MDIQLLSSNIGPDLTLQIAQIIVNHYSPDMHHSYKTTINYHLQFYYTTLVFYKILEYLRYFLGVVVPVTDAPQLSFTKHYHSTTKGLKFS